MNTPVPLILFVYNRPEHTRRTVEALQKNLLADKSALFIFSDGAKSDKDAEKIRPVRDYLKTIKGFSKIEIVLRDKNLGLANSVISGVSEIINLYDRAIILEDDILTSASFLSFMNKTLEFYQEDERIFSVSGYPYPIQIPASYKKDVFVSYRASSWGWGTWKDRWEKADWEVKDFPGFVSDTKKQILFNKAGEDLTPMLKAQMRGEVDSWAIRWSYTHFKNNTYCLYPVVPLCKNIGTDSSGTHSSSSKKFDVILNNLKTDFELVKNPEPDEEINRQIQELFKLSSIRRIINYFRYSL